MSKNLNLILIVGTFLMVSSCKESGPQPSGMVGLYEVSLRLKDGVIDKKSLQDEIKSAMSQAEQEIEKAKTEVQKEINLESIDTTNMEGKIEYAAKKFGKTIAEAGIELGNLGKDLGESVSGLAVNSLDIPENILKNIKLDIELQPDGNIKSKGSLLSLGLNNARWEVKGDDFLFTNENNQLPEIMKIFSRNKDGFTLQKDDVFLDFVKKSP